MTGDKQHYNYCREALYHLNAGIDINEELAYNATREALSITDDTVRRYFLAAIFHGMLVAQPNTEQIIGMLEASFSFDDYHPNTRPQLSDKTDRLPSITIMGSGKKGLKTVNISTLAAITASSSKRLIVTKPCTEAISSLTGSADFLEVLGIQAHKEKERMREIALTTGLGLFFVNSYMPEFMKRYDGVFYAPHAMSYALAGLVSPYNTDSLLYGLALADTELSFNVFEKYKISNPNVVSSTLDGIHFVDEALLLGKTFISTARQGRGEAKTYEFGQLLSDKPVTLESFSPAQSSRKKDNVLKGLRSILPNSQSDLSRTVALNAGLIMYAGQVVESVEEGYTLAATLIKDGSAWTQLNEFVSAAEGNRQLLADLDNKHN